MYLGEVDGGGFLDEPQTFHPVLSKHCLVFYLQKMKQAQGKKSPHDKGNCQSLVPQPWLNLGTQKPFYVVHTCAAGHPYQIGPFVMKFLFNGPLWVLVDYSGCWWTTVDAATSCLLSVYLLPNW